MNAKVMKSVLPGLLLCLIQVQIRAQSPGLEKLSSEYSPETLGEMQSVDPVKYKWLVHMYNEGFLMEDGGQTRPLTREEIQKYDLRNLDLQRSSNTRQMIELPGGARLVLLSADEMLGTFTATLSLEEQAAMKKHIDNSNQDPKGSGTTSTR